MNFRPLQDRVLVLASRSYFRLKFNMQKEKVEHYTRMHMEDMQAFALMNQKPR